GRGHAFHSSVGGRHCGCARSFAAAGVQRTRAEGGQAMTAADIIPALTTEQQKAVEAATRLAPGGRDALLLAVADALWRSGSPPFENARVQAAIQYGVAVRGTRRFSPRERSHDPTTRLSGLRSRRFPRR